MPASEEAGALLDGWMETQRQLWQSWAAAAGASGPGDGGGGERAGEDAQAQWRELVELGLKAWADEVVPVAQAAAESLARGSERMAEMLDLSVRGWKAVMGTATPAEFVRQLSEVLVGGPFAASAQPGLTELWRLSFDELARLQRSWVEELAAGGPGAGPDEGGEPTVIQTINDRYWDAWERTFGRFLESPDVGHTRELTQKSARALRAWVRFRRAAAAYQAVLADGLSRAWSAFLSQLVDRLERHEPPGTGREVLRLWGTTADRVLTELFATEAYARAQGQLVNTAMAYRLAEREVVDLFPQMSHVPSRTELDAANRSIFELKRQVRDLQKAVRDLQPARRKAAAPKKAPPKGGKGQ